MRISDWISDVCSSDLYSPDAKRGFCGSFLDFGTLAGFSFGALLMLGFSLGLGEATMYDWGWRIPFFVAGPMGLVGMYLRSRMEDTPIFREIEMAGEEEQSTSAELKDLLLGYWQPLLIMGGMVVALNVVNYTLLSYMPTYLQRRLGLSTDDAQIGRAQV